MVDFLSNNFTKDLRLRGARRVYLLAATASLAPLTAVIASPAASQSAQGEPVEEVVVQGIRRSLDEALRVKRSADQFVDVISAEDIGNFPDSNIAESAQRIVGVQIDHSDRGEGRQVNIRGLPGNFTLATFNGRSLPNAVLSSAGARSFDFQLLAPEFTQSLEVYKSAVAHIDEGGLSGSVNVRTPRAFDIGKRRLAVSASAEYESNSGELGPRISGLYSNIFADGKLGVTFGLAYRERTPETHKTELDYQVWTEQQGVGNQINNNVGNAGRRKDLDGNGVVEPTQRVRVPQNLYYIIFDEEVRNISAITSIEYRPNPALSLSFDGFYTRVRVESVRQVGNHLLRGAQDLYRSESEVFGDGLPTATLFEVRNLDLRSNGRFEDRDGYIASGVLAAKYQAGLWNFLLEGGYARSGQKFDNLTIANDVYGDGLFIARPGDKVPSLTYINGFDEARLNPDNVVIRNINGAFDRHSYDELTDVKFDARRDFASGFVTSLRFGAKVADRYKYFDNKQLSVDAKGVSDLYGGLPQGVQGPGSYSAAPFLYQVKPGKGSYLGSYDGDATFPTTWLAIDTRGFIEKYGRDAVAAAGTVTNSPYDITDVSEKTVAYYGSADFRTGKWQGNVGVRAVHTRQRSTGYAPDLSAIVVENDIVSLPPEEAVDYQRSYWDYLPSFNVKYQARRDLLLRFAASKTIARPNLGALTPTVNAIDVESQTVTRNNPELDPYRSTNLDIGFEWYFDRRSLLGATLFYKDIDSLIRTQTTNITIDVTEIDTATNTVIREARTFQSTQPVNTRGVEVKGFEVSFQHAFTWLPGLLDGFGTVLNYTWIDNSDPEALTAASEHNYNVIGYYEKERLAVRLAWSWRDSFLSTVAAEPNLNEITQAFGSLDGSIRFRLRQGLSVSLDARNLLDEDRVILYSPGLPADYSDTGRRIVAGLRYSF